MSWQFDPGHTHIGFTGRHLMVSTVRGAFDQFSGTVEFDEQDIVRSKVDIQIEAASVNTRNAQRDEHLRSTDFLDVERYPYLLRVWNYVPDINRDSHGTERYRLFNAARQQALEACGRPLTGKVPAASALGAAAGSPLVAYFLAARTAPAFVENPRQVSAYHYPRRYGAHSPVFSRATLQRQNGSLMLFISGTASIVGHRSIHVGDTAAQTRETLTNIAALLEEANRVERAACFSLGSLACKVYVRRPADLATIRAELSKALEPAAKVIYLQADICRQDLLVEIEATGMCPLKADA